MLNTNKVFHGFRLIFWDKPKQDLLHLLFPSRCVLCSDEWPSKEPICSFCRSELQHTRFEEYSEPTELDKLFWGRVSVKGTFSLLYFHQNSSTQKILHALKYGNKPETGRMLGKEIGEKIKKIDLFKDVDALIPVPIHPKKRFVRGYNQSEELAIGVSQSTEITIDNKFISKLAHTGSQTKQGRFSRWDNVSENFKLSKNRNKYKHILIVDDVITTGATLEAMIRRVQNEYPELSVSIVSLALTK
jgi:competence protein ComFC